MAGFAAVVPLAGADVARRSVLLVLVRGVAEGFVALLQMATEDALQVVCVWVDALLGTATRRSAKSSPTLAKTH